MADTFKIIKLIQSLNVTHDLFDIFSDEDEEDINFSLPPEFTQVSSAVSFSKFVRRNK